MSVRSTSLRVSLLWGIALLLLLASPAAHARDRNRAINEVKAAARAKDSTDILRHSQDAITADDTYAPAHLAFAKALAAIGHDYPKANEELKAFFKLATPADAALVKDAHRLQIEYAIQGENWPLAEELLTKQANANKKDTYAVPRLAYVLMQAGEPDKARPWIELALQITPNDLQSHLLMGNIYKNAKQWQQAADEYQKVLDHAPKGSGLIADANVGMTECKRQLLVKKVIFGAEVTGGVVVFLILVSLIVARRRSAPPVVRPIAPVVRAEQPVKAAVPEGDKEVETADDLVQNTLYKLARMTNMSEGVGYSVTADKDTLLPRAVLNLDMDEMNRLVLDADKLQEWHQRVDGTPFIFTQEKREGSFVQAFGDLKGQMEEREMKLGVPLTHDSTFLGIIFLGIGKDGAAEKGKLKKQFEKNINNIRQLADEAGAALSSMLDEDEAYTDAITKFKTARYVDENLPALIAKTKKSGNFCIGIMLEYDTYKQIQETYGEAQSTTVLKLLAGEVRRVLNEDEDIIARMEDGVFAAFTQHADEAHAVRLGNRLLEQIQSMKISRTLPPPAASIGVAVYPTHAGDAADLLSRTRDALRQSVTNGRGIVTVLPLSAEPSAPTQTGLKASGVPSGILPSSSTAPSPFARGTATAPSPPPPPAAVQAPANPSQASSPFGRAAGLPAPPAMPGGGNSPFGRSAGIPPPVVPGGGSSPFGRPNTPPPAPGGASSPFARPPAAPPAPPPASIPPAGIPSSPTSAMGEETQPIRPAGLPGMVGAPGAAAPSSPPTGGGPFVPGRPASGPPVSPFVPGRPAGGNSPFIPGRPSPASSPFVPGRPATPAATEADENARPPAASPFATNRPAIAEPARAPEPPKQPPAPPPYIPSRRSGPDTETSSPATVPGPATIPGPAVKPPAFAPNPTAPKGAPSPFVPGQRPAAIPPVGVGAPPFAPRPNAGDTAPAPPPFVPSRRPDGPSRQLAGPERPSSTAVANSPAIEKSGYLDHPSFAEALEKAVNEGRTAASEVSLVYLAIDNFADLEAKGRPEVATQTVTTITGMVKSLLNEAEDVAGVWQSNGYVFIKPRTDADGGINFAEWVRVTVSHLSFPELTSPVTVSLGVATFPQDADSALGLMQRAHDACQEAIRNGGDASQQAS